MDAKGPVDESAPGAARTEAIDGVLSCLFDPRVEGKAEVVVRSEHDDLAAGHRDLGPFGAFQGLEEGVEPLLHGFFILVELEALGEDIHRWTPFRSRDDPQAI